MNKYLLYVLSLGIVLTPVYADALSLTNVAPHTKVEIAQNDKDEDDDSPGVKIKTNLQSGDEDEKIKSEFKNKNKNEKANNIKMEKDNKGVWVSWFARFFGKKDLDIKSVVVNRSATSTTVRWVTNQETRGKVYFSTDANMFNSSTTQLSFVENTEFSINHRTVLTNLVPNTTYYYFIEYQNREGQVKKSKIYSFKTMSTQTVDTVVPRILFQTSLNIEDGTSIIWITNESTNSKIWISTVAGVSTTTAPIKSSNSLSLVHSFHLTGLATSTKYYYMLSSTDASGNTVLSTESSFMTDSE